MGKVVIAGAVQVQKCVQWIGLDSPYNGVYHNFRISMLWKINSGKWAQTILTNSSGWSKLYRRSIHDSCHIRWFAECPKKRLRWSVLSRDPSMSRHTYFLHQMVERKNLLDQHCSRLLTAPWVRTRLSSLMEWIISRDSDISYIVLLEKQTSGRVRYVSVQSSWRILTWLLVGTHSGHSRSMQRTTWKSRSRSLIQSRHVWLYHDEVPPKTYSSMIATRFDNLISRYEEPSSMVRWDTPLFVVPWDEDLPGDAIFKAVTTGEKKRANQGVTQVRIEIYPYDSSMN